MQNLDARVSMNHLERIVIGTLISIACAWSFMIMGWWISASLSIYNVVPFSERVIALMALSGLGLGILLDVLCLNKWIARFYEVDWRLALPVYLCWVMIATASFMGLPPETLVLGILAGLYLGRRHKHAGMPADVFARRARTGGLLVAAVTGSAVLGVGVLALRDIHILAEIQRVTGTTSGTATLVVGAAIAVVLSLILVALQYWCTKAASTLAFRWRERA